MSFFIVKDPIISQGFGRRVARGINNRLWVVYDDFRAGAYNIWASYSDNEGLTWTEEQVTLTVEGLNTRSHPEIAADSLGNVHIVYTTNRVLYRRRISTGWEVYEILDTLNSSEPSIIIDSSNNIHISYTLGDTPNSTAIKYRQKSSAGVWQAEETVVTADDQYNPTIAIDFDNNIHIAWWGIGFGAYPTTGQILYRKRTAGVWGTQELITDKSLDQNYPRIAVAPDGYVHVVWDGVGWGENTIYRNIRYRKRDTAGWMEHKAITDVAYPQRYPVIGCDSSSNLFVTWHGTGWGDYTGKDNIQMKKWMEGVWQTQEAITDRPYHQYYPSILSLIPYDGYIVVHFVGNTADANGEQSEIYLDTYVLAPVIITDTVTGLTHRWGPGHYSLELTLGGLSTNWDLISMSKEPLPAVPSEQLGWQGPFSEITEEGMRFYYILPDGTRFYSPAIPNK